MRYSEIREPDYLAGDCMVYAVALANRYGWEPVGIYDEVWTNVPRHIGAQTPDGLYADVRGHSLTRDEFTQGFCNTECELRSITVEEIKRIYKRDNWTVSNV